MDRALACRALVLVILGDVDEVGLVEAPFGLRIGCHRLGHEGRDASVLAGLELWSTEVASVGEGLQVLASHGLVCGTGHVVQLCPVIANVCDLVRNDQVVLGIDSGLHVVAHQARSLGLGGHRTCIGVGE